MIPAGFACYNRMLPSHKLREIIGHRCMRDEVQVDMMEWLCLVKNQSIQEIESGLQRLKDKAWLEDVDIRSGRISMHDLYYDFVMFESQGRVDRSLPFSKRRWVYANNEDFTHLEKTPGGRCWDVLTQVRIQDWFNIEPRIASLEGIKWKFCANLEVLELVGLSDVRGVLNLKGLKCLRSLEICGMHKLDRLEGMEGLKNLTYFRWCYDYEDREDPAKHEYADVDSIVGQFPASLKVLQVYLGILLRPDALARCSSLLKLELTRIRAENLNMSNCKSLENLKLSRVKLLQTLKFCSLEQLQAVELSNNDDFHGLEVMGDYPALRTLDLTRCRALSRLPDLSQATGLVELILRHTGIVLREEDILMLARLPLLKPVLSASDTRCCAELSNGIRGFRIDRRMGYMDGWMDGWMGRTGQSGDMGILMSNTALGIERLDFARMMVLIEEWCGMERMLGCRVKKDLARPPIKIRDYCTFTQAQRDFRPPRHEADRFIPYDSDYANDPRYKWILGPL